jgi:hypothetical protein
MIEEMSTAHGPDIPRMICVSVNAKHSNKSSAILERENSIHLPNCSRVNKTEISFVREFAF